MALYCCTDCPHNKVVLAIIAEICYHKSVIKYYRLCLCPSIYCLPSAITEHIIYREAIKVRGEISDVKSSHTASAQPHIPPYHFAYKDCSVLYSSVVNFCVGVCIKRS